MANLSLTDHFCEAYCNASQAMQSALSQTSLKDFRANRKPLCRFVTVSSPLDFLLDIILSGWKYRISQARACFQTSVLKIPSVMFNGVKFRWELGSSDIPSMYSIIGTRISPGFLQRDFQESVHQQPFWSSVRGVLVSISKPSGRNGVSGRGKEKLSLWTNCG